MSNNNRKQNTPDKDATGEIITWVIIFILMFAFPPVGVLLLILRMRSYARPSKGEDRQSGFISDSTRQTASHYANTVKQTVAEAYSGVASEFSGPRKEKVKKKERSKLDKMSGKFLSVVLLLISVAMLILGVSGFSRAAYDIWAEGQNSWYGLSMGAFFIIGAVITFFSRNIGVRRISRYKKYYALSEDRGIIPIHELARTTGYSVKTVTREVQAMINAGHFEAGSYIDYELEALVLSAEAAKEIRKAAREMQEFQLQPEEPPENQYMAVLKELRELNLSIADVSISGKVDRIEELTGKIFRIVEENPEKQPQIRRFMSYYLPTTFKLLRSYSVLEKQGVKGENIMAAKENIGRILDTLATGFEQQLDQLFQADAMDIAADINVLENLMQQDGLTGDKSEFKTMESAW